ncbi:WhiB family transcriptional regulator [Streptomyces sp. NPDC046985]|uniref:WhiB family transcriptional regulator n=1 Tax=Streptomyces sp. NPDC046985 TaxID=3155377 RepID=UPI0033E14AAE
MDNWREYAACREEDPDLFFPIGSTGPALVQAEQAKTVCAGCSVREQCLEWALSTDQTVGVWGGTSETERRALRRRRAAARRRIG